MNPLDSTRSSAATSQESKRQNFEGLLGTAYCVPRRFGLGAILVITAAFAGMFALLRSLNFDIAVVLGATLYLFGVAAAQMSFPKSPRAASIIVGTILFPVVAIPVCYVFQRWVGRYNFDYSFFMWTVVPAATVLMGPIFGYLSGAVGAGLFLLMDKYRPGKLAQQTSAVSIADNSLHSAIQVKDVSCS